MRVLAALPPMYAIHALLFAMLTAAASAQVSVEWEVIAEPGVQAAAMHDWAAALTRQDLGQVRVHTAPTLPSPHIEQRDRDALLVVAVLTSRNSLQLPGMAVGLTEVHKLRDWMERLRKSVDPAKSAGPTEPTGPTGPAEPAGGPQRLAFGVSAGELVDLRRTLSAPLSEKTKSRPVDELMKVVRRSADMPIRLTPTARAAMREPFAIEDALEDVSLGTATAAMLRPLGLVLVPHSASGQLELIIMEFKEADEFWPVGWPLDRPAQEVAPQWFEFLPVDIDDVPLQEALVALQSRLRMPFLFDYNGMARREIDISQVRVSIAPTRTYYKRALERVLYAARLRPELRVDEAGKPFLWISPHPGAPPK